MVWFGCDEERCNEMKKKEKIYRSRWGIYTSGGVIEMARRIHSYRRGSNGSAGSHGSYSHSSIEVDDLSGVRTEHVKFQTRPSVLEGYMSSACYIWHRSGLTESYPTEEV